MFLRFVFGIVRYVYKNDNRFVSFVPASLDKSSKFAYGRVKP